MLINKMTSTYVTRDDMPDDSWLSPEEMQNYFLVPDSSELGVRIKAHKGTLRLLLSPEGQLADIELIPIVIPAIVKSQVDIMQETLDSIVLASLEG